jgi:hypothetical protein
MTNYASIQDIRAANERAGQHWFSPSTMRFFRSRIGRTVIGGRFFVTSEQYHDGSPRLYTIREALEDGSVETVGGFQAWRSSRDATATARSLAALGWTR